MISVPPGATTGSSLYIHLPAVQSSGYISGQIETTVWNGRGNHRTLTSAESRAASSYAASGVPNDTPCSPRLETTSEKQCRGTSIIAAQWSTTARTGVE